MYNVNKTRLLFLFGLIIGAYLADFYIKSKAKHTSLTKTKINSYPNPISFHLLPNAISTKKYETWFKTKGNTRNIHEIDEIRYGDIQLKQESQYLYETINILCVILEHNDETSEETAKASKSTWAKGCNNVTIIKFELVNKNKKHKIIPIKKTKDNSKWNKLCNLIRQIVISEERDEPAWVIFVYEQTFVLMENLRLMLAPLNHSMGYYLGHAENFWNVKYNSAQAGYVLSQESLRLLQEDFEKTKCDGDYLLLNKEDFTLGKVLSTFNIFPCDTRDQMGYSTFNAYNWQQEFFAGLNYYKNSVYPRKCCSSRVITFKGIERDKFYMYYYLLYQLDVFKTGELGNQPIKPPKDKNFVWKQFLAERGIFTNVTAEEYYKIWEDSGQNPAKFLQHQDNNY